MLVLQSLLRSRCWRLDGEVAGHGKTPELDFDVVTKL